MHAMLKFLQGVDLSHVLCSPSAAPSIKTYSPDLIVHPIFAKEAKPEEAGQLPTSRRSSSDLERTRLMMNSTHYYPGCTF